MKICVIITGKGYPDYGTKYEINIIRKFLKRIWIQNPNLPFFYLGDYDIYGIDILFNYTFSSQ